jgi:hypothetical protein
VQADGSGQAVGLLGQAGGRPVDLAELGPQPVGQPVVAVGDGGVQAVREVGAPRLEEPELVLEAIETAVHLLTGDLEAVDGGTGSGGGGDGPASEQEGRGEDGSGRGMTWVHALLIDSIGPGL